MDATGEKKNRNNANPTTDGIGELVNPKTLLKTVSSPTALNLSMGTAARTAVPAHFRHSQLSDSGAESCDADEQTRLIRSPSSRSHKFIIIPAATSATSVSANTTTGGRTPSTGSGTILAPLRQTISASSLSAMAKLQKAPVLAIPSSSSSTSSTQQVQTSTTTTSAPTVTALSTRTTTPSCKTESQPGFNLNDKQQTMLPLSSPPIVSTNITAPPTITTTSSSDTVHNKQFHQSPVRRSPSPTLPPAGIVKFTIEDYGDSDRTFYDDPSFDATNHNYHHDNHYLQPQYRHIQPHLLPMNTVISPINSASRITPTKSHPALQLLSPTTATTSTTTVQRSPLASLRSATEHVSLAGVELRQRNDRNSSSMRSVVSAYIPSSQELHSLHDTQFKYRQPLQTLQPTSSFSGGVNGNELSASSYLLHDPIANQIYSDVTSVRSLASIGIGSTDGRRLVIRRVPHTATELFSLVHSPSPAPPGADDDDDDSFMDMSDDLKPRQQHWDNKMQFVLACIGYSVGLGNVWRFPYMCYKSGGGVFLVPYCIILFVCSIPLLFMELSIGQYTGRGPIGALGQLCPLFKGAGLASVVVSFLMSTYFSVIIGYSIYYFFTSFKPHMPWTDCNNRWNTLDCWVPQRLNVNMIAPNTSRTPSEEFFENKVLQISPGIEYPGLMRWELFACLICAWLMVYFATWKSIKSSAKVRYFTATFPFVLIIILMGRAVTLEGADKGLRYFFHPNWSELKNANVWINAASQNFNSLGITFGSMISFASYNKYSNNIVRDTIAVSVVNMLTSLLVGVFAFATLGNLALEQNTNVRNVIGDGPGLIFVVYPQAMAKMPYAQLWAVMFFFMLLCLGLNSQFAIVEVVVTSIQDGFPNWIKRHLGYHEIVVLFVCVISFLFGLPNLIQGGIYYFQLMDHYAASISIMFLAFCQMIAIAWFYGTGRLSKNIKQMTGKAPSLYLKSCWILLGPCLLFGIWVLSLINYEEPSYHNGRYKYPDWAYGIGWMFASFSLICIPGYAIINLVRSQGDTFWERLKNTLRPNIYECRICGEHHCEHDFPEQEQYMLAQEFAGIYKPTMPMKMPLPVQMVQMGGQKVSYNPMQLQNEQQQQPQSHQYQEKPKYSGPQSTHEKPEHTYEASGNEQLAEHDDQLTQLPTTSTGRNGASIR